MLLARLHSSLIAPNSKIFKSQLIFWFSLSLTFSAIYSFLGWQEAFSSGYVVQDDARQHVFWMQRFLDPELFPKDLIADYFQSVAPAGYSAIYQLMAGLGINPLLMSKILPSVLGLMTTGYCFGVCLEILPVPATGFIATLLLNQNLWMKDDLVSATPRAFAYPLFLAFLYYLLRRSLFGSLVAIALLGLFYPQSMFVGVGILVLRLLDWKSGYNALSGKIRFSQERHNYLFCAAGVGVALLVMLPYILTSSEFGPAICAAQARNLPEFLPGGRAAFFHETPTEYWLDGKRSGMFPKSLFTPVTLCAALLLPVMLLFPSRFPRIRQILPNIKILPQMFLASVGMFFAAHALLFKLHLPSRYTGQSFRIIVAILAAIALTAILDALRGSREQGAGSRGEKGAGGELTTPHSPLPLFLALALTAVIGAALIFYPSLVKNFPLTQYQVGEVPLLYEFFHEQPKDILIASFSDEVNNLPTFSQRSILVGSEYAVPYQVGYYQKLRKRTIDLIRAQYSQDLAEVKQLIQKYGVDFFLLDSTAFTPGYLAGNSWLNQYQPLVTDTVSRLEKGNVPALAKLVEPCSVFKNENLVVIQAECVVREGVGSRE